MKKKKKTKSRISDRSRKIHTLTKKIDKIYQKINKGSEKQVQERIKNLQEELMLIDKQKRKKRKKTKKTKKTKWKNKKRIRAGILVAGEWQPHEGCTSLTKEVDSVTASEKKVELTDDPATSGDDQIRKGQKFKIQKIEGQNCRAESDDDDELTVHSVTGKVIIFDEEPEADEGSGKCEIKREAHGAVPAATPDNEMGAGTMALIGLGGAAVGAIGVGVKNLLMKRKNQRENEEKLILLKEKAEEAYEEKKLKLAIVRMRSGSRMEDSEGNRNVSDEFYDKYYQEYENKLEEWSEEYKKNFRAGMRKKRKKKKKRSGAIIKEKNKT
jgi:hypothetical protein